MENARYRAIGIVCVAGENMDDLQLRCKSLMRLCPELGNMDIYNQDSTPCGKMSREIIFMPDVQPEQITHFSL